MYIFTKRVFDIVLSLIGMVVFSPVFLIIIIAILLDSGGPVFFRQKRVGIHRVEFRIYKFRTMEKDAPKYVPTGELNDPYKHITRVGRFMRKTSLDELPQIINILKGDMSIVGPRPVIKADKELIDAREKYGANDVLPGLTGWAQINGRDKISPEDKAKLDGYYVDHRSFWFDWKCLFGTILSVLKAEDIVEGGEEQPKRYDADQDD